MELEPFSSGGLSCCGLVWAAVNALKPIFAFCGNEWKGVSLFDTHFLSLTRLLIRVIWEDILKIVVNSIITLPLSREWRECPPSRLVDAFSITFESQVQILQPFFLPGESSRFLLGIFCFRMSLLELVEMMTAYWKMRNEHTAASCVRRGGEIAPPSSNRDNAARCELTDRIVESAIGFPSEGGKLVSTDVVVSTTDGTE